MRPTRQRILCVDDHRDICLMLVSLLGLANYDAVTAGTVDEALRLARGERFGLYILDKRLPDGSGLELCQRIRAIDRQTPIIFYSGAVSESDRGDGLSSGANAYLFKPGIDELVDTVRGLLSESAGVSADG